MAVVTGQVMLLSVGRIAKQGRVRMVSLLLINNYSVHDDIREVS